MAIVPVTRARLGELRPSFGICKTSRIMRERPAGYLAFAGRHACCKTDRVAMERCNFEAKGDDREPSIPRR